MARAYVLIETAIGKTPSVVQALRQIQGIKAADPITGPYDIMVVIEAADPGVIGQTVMRHVHNTDGVSKTMTSFVVDYCG